MERTVRGLAENSIDDRVLAMPTIEQCARAGSNVNPDNAAEDIVVWLRVWNTASNAQKTPLGVLCTLRVDL